SCMKFLRTCWNSCERKLLFRIFRFFETMCTASYLTLADRSLKTRESVWHLIMRLTGRQSSIRYSKVMGCRRTPRPGLSIGHTIQIFPATFSIQHGPLHYWMLHI